MEQRPNDIRSRREAIRISQRQLAALCSIRPETLSRIEKGRDHVPGYVDMILFLIERDERSLRRALRKVETPAPLEGSTEGDAIEMDAPAAEVAQ